MELQEMKEQLIEWMNLMKHGYRDSDMYLYEEFTPVGWSIRIKLYTSINVYSIVAKNSLSLASNKGYLGCVYSSRKSRAGEDWNRGGDLADGNFCYETWVKILSDIIGTELVEIHRSIKFLYEKE